MGDRAEDLRHEHMLMDSEWASDPNVLAIWADYERESKAECDAVSAATEELRKQEADLRELFRDRWKALRDERNAKLRAYRRRWRRR